MCEVASDTLGIKADAKEVPLETRVKHLEDTVSRMRISKRNTDLQINALCRHLNVHFDNQYAISKVRVVECSSESAGMWPSEELF